MRRPNALGNAIAAINPPVWKSLRKRRAWGVKHFLLMIALMAAVMADFFIAKRVFHIRHSPINPEALVAFNP